MQRTFRDLALSCVVALPLAVSAIAQQPDNTKTNKDNRPTADQQKETKADRDLAAKIRESVIADKSLSTYAHNVKIIVQNGVITLKGPVRSEAERNAVQAKAKQFADSATIENQMTVAPPK
jgi:hyperosmotically inducible periplasmic protein